MPAPERRAVHQPAVAESRATVSRADMVRGVFETMSKETGTVAVLGCVLAVIMIAFIWSISAGCVAIVWWLLSIAFEMPGPSVAGCYAIGIALQMVRGIFSRGKSE